MIKNIKSELESKYTSTNIKLLHNFDRLKEIHNGTFRPISIQLAPTDKCNLNCCFCSVKNREMKQLTYEQVKKAVYDLWELGAKTIEITGGGDPTLFPEINETIQFCFDLGLKLGLITNGVLLNRKISQESLGYLTWLRVSLNCLDYLDNITLEIPENVDLGFSYVWNEKSTFDTVKKVVDYKERYGAKYIRVVPDCRFVEFIEEYKKSAMGEINKIIGVKDIFFQQKEYNSPSRCWIGYLKPFLNSDGYIYHCSANPLIDLKFNENFRMGRIEDVRKIWNWKNVKPFDTQYCAQCFFKEHNQLIEDLLLDVEHKDFI